MKTTCNVEPDTKPPPAPPCPAHTATDAPAADEGREPTSTQLYLTAMSAFFSGFADDASGSAP